MKRQLPKAYLRMDPNLDQTHPDPGAFVRLLCAAARQPERGRFSSRQLLDSILGKKLAASLVARRDVIQDGGKWYVVGWDEWQEGDLTVGERQRRIRDRRVTSPLSDRDNAVTPALPEPTQTVRRKDVKTEDVRQGSLEPVSPLRVREGPTHISELLPRVVRP